MTEKEKQKDEEEIKQFLLRTGTQVKCPKCSEMNRYINIYSTEKIIQITADMTIFGCEFCAEKLFSCEYR